MQESEASEVDSPNMKHCQKAIASTLRIKVCPLGTILKKYLTALEKAKGLTDGEVREQGSMVRAVTGMKTDQDQESSTSRNVSVATRKMKDHFETLKASLSEKLEELD